LRYTLLAPNEVNVVYIDFLSLICNKYSKGLSIGANEVSCVLEEEITFSELKIALTLLAPNEVNLVYIDILSIICTKYAKEMSIGASEIFSFFKEEIHIFRSINCAKHDLLQIK
jgi:hypothetical protein